MERGREMERKQWKVKTEKVKKGKKESESKIRRGVEREGRRG